MGEEKTKKKQSFAKKIKQRCESFANSAKYAVVGCAYCLKRPKYTVLFAILFFCFLHFLTFFKDGDGNWRILWSGLTVGEKFNMLERVTISTFGNFTSLYGLMLVALALLQSMAITLVVFAWRNRQKRAAIDGVEAGGVASLLGFAALGCPTCGVSFLMPILSAIAGASASILAERISIVLAIVAFLLLLYAIIKLGYTVYVIVGSSKRREK